MNKKCFRCKESKEINQFYKHPEMHDGRLNKCINCTKKDASVRTIPRLCFTCGNSFLTWPTEIKRGGGITCSRKCYYERFKKIVKRDEYSPNWKGDNVGIQALHNWVNRKLGKPSCCSKCGNTQAKKYEWANISRKYKRDINDWTRLCKKCHIIYDGSKSFKNYKRLTYKEFIKLKNI
jgi:hypothetical protein